MNLMYRLGAHAKHAIKMLPSKTQKSAAYGTDIISKLQVKSSRHKTMFAILNSNHQHHLQVDFAAHFRASFSTIKFNGKSDST